MPKQKKPLSGKTIRWTFDDGPTRGMTFEHHFYADGTVAYRSVEEGDGDEDTGTPESDRSKYRAFEIAEDVVLASYLGESGYTLTVALSFADGRIAAFASNEKKWYPCEGTFEEVERERSKAA